MSYTPTTTNDEEQEVAAAFERWTPERTEESDERATGAGLDSASLLALFGSGA